MICRQKGICILVLLIVASFVSLPAEGAGPVFNSTNRHYYQLVEVANGINWYDAKTSAESMKCHLMTGYLATITSSNEQNFIINNFPEVLPNAVWIGAKDESARNPSATRASFRWGVESSGEYPLDVQNPTYWYQGEPDGFPVHTCMDIAAGSWMWGDEDCNTLLHYYLVEYSAPILLSFPVNASNGIPVNEKDCSLDPDYLDFQMIIATGFPIDEDDSCIGENYNKILWKSR